MAGKTISEMEGFRRPALLAFPTPLDVGQDPVHYAAAGAICWLAAWAVLAAGSRVGSMAGQAGVPLALFPAAGAG